ncbi:MAG: flagellar hook-length control protein FliK [Mariprofundus sp.]|nr:flagellar hook-length control protein FliK [Mariprofundus sp.]
MIEQVNGAGLSGMVGKSTKHGKSSLFAKLMSMLEKHTETSGKGKGFQLQAGKLSKGEGLAGLSEKTDAFILAKNKHLLALAEKGKAESEGDETVMPLLMAHVIIDSTVPLKKTGKSDVNVGLIKGFEKADQGNALLDKTAQMMAEKQLDMLMAQQKNKLGQQVQDTDLKSALLTSGKGDVSELLLQKGQMSEQLLQKGQMSEQLLQKGQMSGQALKTTPLGGLGKTDGAVVNTALNLEADVAVRTIETQALADKKAVATAQVNQVSGAKPDVKTLAEAMSLTAASHVQKFKAVQSQQVQQVQPLAAASVASAGQLSMSEVSLTDSGSQFSDQRGGQDARLLNAATGEAKLTASSTSTQGNFQSYLTSKTTPPMSVFDSMNHIAQSAKNGQTKIEIQLDPANLGKIHISLQSDAGKQLQVHMIVDQSMTRAALEQQLPQLRSALAQQGFDLSGFSMDSQDQQASNGGDDAQKSKSHHSSDQTEVNMTDVPVDQEQRVMPGSGLSIRV